MRETFLLDINFEGTDTVDTVYIPRGALHESVTKIGIGLCELSADEINITVYNAVGQSIMEVDF